jgi:2-polyprenyl-3-methyl-5-hydroxy-6-metoxy-1,4-benzoquinol methylase
MSQATTMPPMKNDFGGWAQHYASTPYDHYRLEVYQLFIDILDQMKRHSRVLDVGAGAGHLQYEYFRRYPESKCEFVLLDASRELLKTAAARFESRSKQVSVVVRSYNSVDWSDDLGRFDAIVSNNSLFHLRPQKLKSFYQSCFALLKQNGILLNQQAFGYESENSPDVVDAFSQFVQTIPPSIMPQYQILMTAEEIKRLKRRKVAAGRRRVRAMEKARAAGKPIAEADEHQYLTAERHLEYMRRAGFTAGSIWQKRDFAVLMGVKGKPLRRYP